MLLYQTIVSSVARRAPRPPCHNRSMEPLIRHISDTALWAATFRARESERPDALFHDPFAARLAGDRGPQIVAGIPHAADNSWAWIMRTYLFDRVIRSSVERGVDTVLNIAAGLDARPYRLDLPPSLLWVEVDLPDLLAYKQEILAAERPKCRLEQIALDLADVTARRQLFQRLGKGIVLSEGLLIYFSPEEVAALGRDLAAAGFHCWLFDLASPALLKMLQATTGRSTAEAGAPMRFAPADRLAFFEPLGWKPAEVHSVMEAGLQTGRFPRELLTSPPPMPPGVEGEIWSGVCLLQRA